MKTAFNLFSVQPLYPNICLLQMPPLRYFQVVSVLGQTLALCKALCFMGLNGNMLLHLLTRTMKLVADVRAKLLSHITKSLEIKVMVCKSDKLI